MPDQNCGGENKNNRGMYFYKTRFGNIFFLFRDGILKLSGQHGHSVQTIPPFPVNVPGSGLPSLFYDINIAKNRFPDGNRIAYIEFFGGINK